ncbi:MAG: hypothetical protein CMI54_01170 [Parcubacteria group bacterium]|nr:hypothetical protein [Parcubacteria group bacterium]|tara:strand:- start:51295 stop:52431 length:1137 start_codon:yes stop_codon:yes gene_type:complete
MFFVHPQIKFNIENLKLVFYSFLKSPDLETLNKKLSFYFPDKTLVFTDMGRSAFRLIIERFNLQNSQIILPAYICDIFFPIFKQYNISPIFLDIEKDTFNLNSNLLLDKINPEVKSILVSHTYGLPLDIKKIKEIAGKEVLVIEDCAHSFGAKINEAFVGNFGDAALFSLYKSFPSLRGGMAVLPKNEESSLPKTNFNFRDFISLLNSCSSFAYFFKKYGNEISPKFLRKEKLDNPSQLNRVSLNLFLNFFNGFEKNLDNRIQLALLFKEELRKLGFKVQDSRNNVFTYLSALVPESINRDQLVKKLRKYNVFCTRIWHTPIILNPKVQKEYNLNLAEFPNTINATKRIINFPLQNFYTEKDIRKMVSALDKSMHDMV